MYTIKIHLRKKNLTAKIERLSSKERKVIIKIFFTSPNKIKNDT